MWYLTERARRVRRMIFAKPKSKILTTPEDVNAMLSGFKSRCIRILSLHGGGGGGQRIRRTLSYHARKSARTLRGSRTGRAEDRANRPCSAFAATHELSTGIDKLLIFISTSRLIASCPSSVTLDPRPSQRRHDRPWKAALPGSLTLTSLRHPKALLSHVPGTASSCMYDSAEASCRP